MAPLPGEDEPEEIAKVSNAVVLAYHNGYLYATGWSGAAPTWAESDVTEQISVHKIAKINIQTHEVSDAVSVDPIPTPYAIIWDHNDVMYVSGSATLGNNLFRKWSGSSWDVVGGGLNIYDEQHSQAIYMASDGTNIWLSGLFSGASNSGTPVGSTNVIRWNVDSGLWSAVDTGLGYGDTMASITVLDTNVFVASNVGAKLRRYSAVTGLGLSLAAPDVIPSDLVTLAGTLYAAGEFTSIGGSTIKGIAKWTAGSWSALGSGISGGGETVLGLATNGYSVFAYGSFTSAGGLSAPGKARWQISPGADLKFDSGYVSSFSSAVMSLSGFPGQVCEIQQLDFSDDAWEAVGTFTLDSSGTATVTKSLNSGLGYFRAISIEKAFPSVNAFGSIVGSITPGYWMVGNPFPPLTLSTIAGTLPDGCTADLWTNGNWRTESLMDEGWTTDYTVGMGEAVLFHNTSGSSQTYTVYGVFGTNTFTRNIKTGFSLNVSPLFRKLSGGSATQVDALSSTSLGGLAALPVNSSDNPKANLYRNKDGGSGSYNSYTLTTGGQWQIGGVNTTVPILLGEGFWVYSRFGSDQTWTVPLTIWE